MSKTVGARVDSNVKEKLEEIARRRGIKLADIVKEAIESYLERDTQAEEPKELPENIEAILKEFNERVKEYVEKVKQFCEEHAKEIISTHVSEKDKFEYWRDVCLHRYRTITRHNLSVYIEDHLLKKLNLSALDSDQLVKLQKRLNEIVNAAVNELYASQYPPIYPA